MSNAKFTSVFASVFVFAVSLVVMGCMGITIDVGDASATVGDDNANLPINERYAMAKPMNAGSVIVDAEKDSITLVTKTLGGCEKLDDEFIWNADFYQGDTSTFGYRFSEDTLFLSTRSLIEKGFEEPEEMLVERILIGEKNEGLDGVWFMVPCSYYNGQLRCSEYAYEEYLLIDGGDVEWRALDKAKADYMESVFIDELFSYIGSQSSALQLETVFYGMETESTAMRYGIDVVSQSKTSVTFTYADLEFDVALIYARFKDSVHVVVKSGETECVGVHREVPIMTDEECRADYADKLREEDSGIWTYWSQNEDEFARCIDGILGREN